MIRKLLFVSVLTASFAAHAGGKKMDDFLTAELGLDQARAEQVKEILETTRDASKELRGKHFEEMKAIREETREKLATILTEDEMEKFDSRRRHDHDFKHDKGKRFEKDCRLEDAE